MFLEKYRKNETQLNVEDTFKKVERHRMGNNDVLHENECDVAT